MTWLHPDVGAPLTFEEVKRLVEAASPAVELRLDEGGKGRYLVARKKLHAGEIMLSEGTLFHGCTDAQQCRKVCKKEQADIAAEVIKEGHENDYEEDCVHPCSPLVDCLSGILLAQHTALHSEDKGERARSKLRVRQLESLACTSKQSVMSDELCQQFLDIISPEFVGSTSTDDFRSILRTLSSNRFSGIDCSLDVMFAGSMFEHSCEPNCFAGHWHRTNLQPRLYRALRDIEVGEPLSISYIQLTDLYLPRSGRAEVLDSWDFVCSCERCTSAPELTRAFVCPACSLPELCPVQPGLDAPELKCLKCEHIADAAYAARCFSLEAFLARLSKGDEEALPNPGEDGNGNNNVIGNFHHAAFLVAWQTFANGPSIESLHTYASAIEDLITCISRFHGDNRHPDLLEMYHIMAELHTGDLVGQQHYLQDEYATQQRYYPEEAAKQDQEIWNLCSGKGPHAPSYAEERPSAEDLDVMD